MEPTMKDKMLAVDDEGIFRTIREPAFYVDFDLRGKVFEIDPSLNPDIDPVHPFSGLDMSGYDPLGNEV